MMTLSSALIKLIAAGLICGGLLSLAAGAQKEILRLGCSCLLVVVLITLLQNGERSMPDFAPYRAEIQMHVEDAQRINRQMLLEQTCRGLKQAAEEQASALGLACEVQVECTSESSGLLSISQVQVNYHGGPREQLSTLRQWIKTQFSVSDEIILIQEGG